MSAPLHKLTKKEIVWLAGHRCKHHHSYLEHYECFLTAHPSEHHTIGFLDIEASGLQADFGFMLSYCIKIKNGKMLSNVLTKDDIASSTKGDEDRRLITELVKDLYKVDEVVTYYGNDYRYDVPYVRTRAVSMGIPFPLFGTLKQTDMYPIVKAKFRLSRNRQENACRTLLGETEKNHISGAIWRQAGRGDKKALAYVLDHNLRDARDLEKLHAKIIGFSKGTPGRF